MAVLVEALNVVVRINRIRVKFSGGIKAFKKSVPNKTLCMDSRLARVGFMSPADVGNFIDYLEENGLTFVSDGKARDIVVIDQFKGPTTVCNWIQLITVKFQGRECLACRLKSEPDHALSLYVPDGWKADGKKILFIKNEESEKRLLYMGKNGNVEHYFDMDTGRDLYVGRTTRGEDRK